MIDGIHYCILAAFVLDLILGDPRWLPHPVRLIGFAAKVGEAALTKVLGRSYVGGIAFALIIVAGSFWAVWGILSLCEHWDRRIALTVQTVLLYFAFATRDLDVEGRRVYRDLQAGKIDAARASLSMIVGRDTDHLDEREIVRGTVESVAESTCDGVVAPILFACVGGAPLAWLYKAINTLDSMVGHKDGRYAKFGWASARLDTVANFVPARLAGILMVVAGGLCTTRWAAAWRVMIRDGRKSPSINAGVPEAAMAGALGVRLGGTNVYQGVPETRPFLGDPERDLERDDIRRAIHIMYFTAVFSLVIGLGLRWVILSGLTHLSWRW